MSKGVKIEEIAARWFAKRDREDWSPAQQTKLDAWLKASTEHRIAFIRVEVTWRKLRKLRRLKELAKQMEHHGLLPNGQLSGSHAR